MLVRKGGSGARTAATPYLYYAKIRFIRKIPKNFCCRYYPRARPRLQKVYMGYLLLLHNSISTLFHNAKVFHCAIVPMYIKYTLTLLYYCIFISLYTYLFISLFIYINPPLHQSIFAIVSLCYLCAAVFVPVPVSRSRVRSRDQSATAAATLYTSIQV